MSLFQHGPFTSTSGITLPYKIECDALTDEDWEVIAQQALDILPPFRWVYGVPRGGLRLAALLQFHRSSMSKTALFVDDVWTTGGSMRKAIRGLGVEKWMGYVAFARGPLPSNVQFFMRTNETDK
jgi:orotate phosphoribosyltransferase